MLEPSTPCCSLPGKAYLAPVDRPLWRIFLHIALLAFVARRAGGVAMLYLDRASAWLIAATILQCVAALVASIAIWLGRFVTGSLHALAAAFVIGSVVQIAVLGSVAVPSAVAQALIGVLAAEALGYFIQRAQNEPE
jgi:uncharacterized membrane protein